MARMTDPILSQKMLAATDRASERDIRLRIAMQAKQSEDRAGGSAHDVKLLVCGDQLVRKQLRRAFSFLQQGGVAGAFYSQTSTLGRDRSIRRNTV